MARIGVSGPIRGGRATGWASGRRDSAHGTWVSRRALPWRRACCCRRSAAGNPVHVRTMASVGGAMGSRVGQQRRERGARGPGASPAGVGVWPHVRMRRRARICLHARACRRVAACAHCACAGARVFACMRARASPCVGERVRAATTRSIASTTSGGGRAGRAGHACACAREWAGKHGQGSNASLRITLTGCS